MSDPAGAPGVRACLRAGQVLRLVLNNSDNALEEARLRIGEHLEPLQLGPRVTNRFEVVFEELVSNVLRYGLASAGEHSVLVTVAAEPQRIVLTIEDDGIAFDPFSREDPPAPASLADAQIGGLGIPLVRRLAAEVRYERDPASDGWRELVGSSGRPINRVTVTLAAQA